MKEPIRIDAYVVETLLPDLVGHDRQPSAFLVYLYLTYRGTRGHPVDVSLQTIAAETGLSKSAVQRSLRTLVRRRLIRTDRASRTAVPRHVVLRPWTRR